MEYSGRVVFFNKSQPTKEINKGVNNILISHPFLICFLCGLLSAHVSLPYYTLVLIFDLVHITLSPSSLSLYKSFTRNGRKMLH
jgi:hypothetical protein